MYGPMWHYKQCHTLYVSIHTVHRGLGCELHTAQPMGHRSLTFMSHFYMSVAVWGYLNEHVRMSFLGLFNFNAP